MYKILFSCLILALDWIFFSGCGASVSDRYEKKNSSEQVKGNSSEKDFDMAPYREEIIVENPETTKIISNQEIWYSYPEQDSTSDQRNSTQQKKPGYRVQVFSTDKLEEANSMRSEIYFKTNKKNVYVIFEPPFYKIKVGDFITISEANQLSFKLNQMGYTETHVVRDSVNVLH